MMKTALITGASSGIGEACSLALSDKGFHVCLTARREQRLGELVSRINAKHGPGLAIFQAGDVTDETVRRKTLELVLSQWSRLDVLVNNAGTALPGVIEEVSLPAVRQQFETNVLACLAWMQLVGPVMRAQRQGRIINMSSVSGRMAFPGLGIYAASKFALEAISDAARLEYRPWGVRVILIEPGSVTTEIWQKGRDLVAEQAAGWETSPFRDIYEVHVKHAEELMSGRGPSARIVAAAVVRAATAKRPKARYCLPLDAKIISALAHLPTGVRDWLILRMMKA